MSLHHVRTTAFKIHSAGDTSERETSSARAVVSHQPSHVVLRAAASMQPCQSAAMHAPEPAPALKASTWFEVQSNLGQQPCMQLPFFVAVHVGAGLHAHAKESRYNATMAAACKAAGAHMPLLRVCLNQIHVGHRICECMHTCMCVQYLHPSASLHVRMHAPLHVSLHVRIQACTSS